MTQKLNERFEECKWCNGTGDDGGGYRACPDCESTGVKGGRSALEELDKELERLSSELKEEENETV